MMSMKSYLPRAFVSGINLSAIGIYCIIACTVSMGHADWKSDANARIEQIRKRDALITVVDSQGNPVPNLIIDIDQTKQSFPFGSAINTNVSNSRYTDFFKTHFNWAVMENESKWYSNEPSRDNVTYNSADRIYDFCNANGITMRGHCIFWASENTVQDWVKALPYAPYPESSELFDEMIERMDSVVNHFKGKFVHWDVNNEMCNNSFYKDRLGIDIHTWMFQAANAIDPDCLLFLNDYNVISGGWNLNSFYQKAEDLLARGAPLHGLGVQCHMGGGFNRQDALNRFNTLAQLNLPIWVTEFDVAQADENLRADDLEDFYRLAYSHPSVEGIIMWGFWQNSHWRENCYIVNSDWTLNAAGIRYEALLDEWSTSETGFIDLDGNMNFRGFHGTYTVTLTAPGEAPEVHTIELEPGATAAVFEIETALTPPTPDEQAPSAPTGLAADPGDGRVLLDWNDNTETDLDSYTVYRSLTQGADYGLLAAGIKASDYIDYDVNNGTTYYYVITALDFWSNESDISNEVEVTPALGADQDPYPGPAPHAIPGRIEAENYDLGGEGFAYHDSDSTNDGGVYRTDGVDVQECGEGGYNVGWITSGEWLEYTVDVAATGLYDIELRVASDSNDGSLRIEFDNVDVTGSISFPTTGDWQTYFSVYVTDVRLTQGRHVMRISMEADLFNINWLNFTQIPYGDFTGDRIVNSDDLPGFFEIWLSSDCGDLDINDDCVINLYEFAELAKNWLNTSLLDTQPPAPDPMQWAAGGEPAAIADNRITMTAATASDLRSPPVAYYFECTTDAAASSAWQTSPSYTTPKLEPDTPYTFKVKARDNYYLTPNETQWSDEASATTGPPSYELAIIGDWTTGTTHTVQPGRNRALIFFAHAEHDNGTITLNSVTYGGQPMTKIIDQNVGTAYTANVTAFILDEAGIAAAAESGTLVPVWSTPPGAVVYTSVFLEDVDQANLIGVSNAANTPSSSPNPITTAVLSTSEKDMVFVAATCGNLDSYTLNNGFTEGFDQQFGDATTGGTAVAGYKAASGAAEIPSATYNSDVNRQVIIGFVVKSL